MYFFTVTNIILSNASNCNDDIIKEKDPKRHSIGVKMQVSQKCISAFK